MQRCCNCMKEVFRWLEGYENIYKISNFGKIISYARNKEGKVMCLKYDKDGYVKVNLSKNRCVKTYFVHRLVASSFIKSTEERHFVNHMNGKKDDNRAVNLEWVNRSENQIHAYNNNLQVSRKGETHPNSKLKAEDVFNIRKSNLSNRELSDIFKITKGHVNDIKSYKKWKHIK